MKKLIVGIAKFHYFFVFKDRATHAPNPIDTSQYIFYPQEFKKSRVLHASSHSWHAILFSLTLSGQPRDEGLVFI